MDVKCMKKALKIHFFAHFSYKNIITSMYSKPPSATKTFPCTNNGTINSEEMVTLILKIYNENRLIQTLKIRED